MILTFTDSNGTEYELDGSQNGRPEIIWQRREGNDYWELARDGGGAEVQQFIDRVMKLRAFQ